jgi:siroheme synthase (precorrin-2 oxidase/ferrochelatase)
MKRKMMMRMKIKAKLLENKKILFNGQGEEALKKIKELLKQ